MYNRGLHTRFLYYVINNNHMPSILIEPIFNAQNI